MIAVRRFPEGAFLAGFHGARVMHSTRRGPSIDALRICVKIERDLHQMCKSDLILCAKINSGYRFSGECVLALWVKPYLRLAREI